MIEILTIED